MSSPVALPYPSKSTLTSPPADVSILDLDKDGDVILSLSVGEFCDEVTPAQLRDWTRAARAWLDRVDQLATRYEAITAQPTAEGGR
ncbi:hypothetical protein ACFW4X_10915 [Streptomyces smyrnaeus]|uniref:hypothetical protein n=1 Tax=Streptomyces smyrnaeus TaxID=1387713 RepID=UPI0036C0C590